jgi:hypothetical protein
MQCASYLPNLYRYYIHAPLSLFSKPILLVPENQVQKLLDEINSAFRISIKLPRDPFLLAFYQDGTPAPALLGISNNRETVGKMEQSIPSPPENFGECPASASPEEERSFERFKEKMERAAAAAQKKKHAALKKAKAKDRLAAHVNWCEALKRGQRYLGLRPLGCPGDLPAPDASLSWDEQQEYEREQKIKYGHILQPFNLSQAAPHPFDQDVVFVCVDVEAYERDHSLITEVGISTLDTADIKSLAAGYGGFDWMERIRSRHFRVSEHQHLKNTSFCTGDPEKFLFGRSEFVSIKEVGGAVDSCFEPPYSSDFIHDARFKAQDDRDVAIKKIDDQLQYMSLKPQDSVGGELPQWRMELVHGQGPANAEQDLANEVAVSNTLSHSELTEGCQAAECSSRGPNLSCRQIAERYPAESHQSPAKKPKYRNVVLVGHDLDADLHYLSILKSKIFHKPPAVTYPQSVDPENPLRKHIIESLDTARLYQVFKRDSNIASLAKILVGVERTGWHLHNGGNDARYTLEAMIGILVRARLKEDDLETMDSSVRGASGSAGDESQQPEDVLAKKINAKQRAVEKEERENAAMWRHAIGPYGSEGEVLSQPYMPPTDGTTKDDQCEPSTKDTDHEGKLPKDRSKGASMACQAAPNADQSMAETQPEPGAYAWSSSPRANVDGGVQDAGAEG